MKENTKSPVKDDTRKIKSAKKMREIMTAYYIDAKTAGENNKKVAWITSGGPVEPLIAMDVIPVYPENHGAMIGASKMGVDLCGKAEEMGYCRDLCSYARADIASSFTGGGPIGGLPEPDLLICANNICGTVLKWYEVQARHYKVPLFILDTPCGHGGMTPEAGQYIRKQLEEYFNFLGECCGTGFNFERLKETGRLSVQAMKLWQDILDTSMHKPSPFSAFDAFFHLALIVTLRGTQVVIDYYRELLKELNQRIEHNISSIENEKYRLLWDNLPVWYRTRWLSEKFASHNACLVADTYTSAWSATLSCMDENNFIDSMVEGYTRVYLNLSINEMAESVKKMIKKYDVNGMVMHSNRSCKPYSFAQYEIRRKVQDELNIPCLIIEADMVDERSFSEGPVENRIDAFMEMIRGNT